MKRITTFLVCASLLLFSCKKDNALTQGQLNGQELSKFIFGEQITFVVVKDSGTGNEFESGSNLIINNDGTAKIAGSDVILNLGTLKSFDIEKTAGGDLILDLFY